MSEDTAKVELGSVEWDSNGRGYVEVRVAGCGGIVAKFTFYQRSELANATRRAKWFVSCWNAFGEEGTR